MDEFILFWVGGFGAVAAMVLMAVVLTWEPRNSRRPDTCPYCVAVARTKPAVGHCWRCGGRYDKGHYSVDWGAVNLDLFRGYHGRDPEGFVGRSPNSVKGKSPRNARRRLSKGTP